MMSTKSNKIQYKWLHLYISKYNFLHLIIWWLKHFAEYMLITSSQNGTKIKAMFSQDKSLSTGLKINKNKNQSLKNKFEKTSSKWSPLLIQTVMKKLTDGNCMNTASKITSQKANNDWFHMLKLLYNSFFAINFYYFSWHFTEIF